MTRDALTGSRIRERRVMAGQKQADLAKRIGISASYLNLIEHNRRRIGGKLLMAISGALGVEATLLTEGAEAAQIAALREAAAGGKGVERSSSLQRIASAGTLAAGPKATLGDGTASPAIGEDSPRGFVPFRSLQSYENLLSLQAQTR